MIATRLSRFLYRSIVSHCLAFSKRLVAIVSAILRGPNRVPGNRVQEELSKAVYFCPQSNEELVDPICVEENPQKITFEDITSAAFKIKCGIANTPCVV